MFFEPFIEKTCCNMLKTLINFKSFMYFIAKAMKISCVDFLFLISSSV